MWLNSYGRGGPTFDVCTFGASSTQSLRKCESAASTYSFGAFDADKIFHFSGVNDVADNPEQSDALMYASRLQYSFWDKEPGYYGTGNYLGNKDIFTVGIAYRQKSDGAASPAAVGDYSQLTIDLLIEKRISGGAVSLEAAYFDYDTGDVFLNVMKNCDPLLSGPELAIDRSPL